MCSIYCFCRILLENYSLSCFAPKKQKYVFAHFPFRPIPIICFDFVLSLFVMPHCIKEGSTFVWAFLMRSPCRALRESGPSREHRWRSRRARGDTQNGPCTSQNRKHSIEISLNVLTPKTHYTNAQSQSHKLHSDRRAITNPGPT